MVGIYLFISESIHRNHLHTLCMYWRYNKKYNTNIKKTIFEIMNNYKKKKIIISWKFGYHVDFVLKEKMRTKFPK